MIKLMKLKPHNDAFIMLLILLCVRTQLNTLMDGVHSISNIFKQFITLFTIFQSDKEMVKE